MEKFAARKIKSKQNKNHEVCGFSTKYRRRNLNLLTNKCFRGVVKFYRLDLVIEIGTQIQIIINEWTHIMVAWKCYGYNLFKTSFLHQWL